MEISHITLIVKDLNKTSVLLNTLFDAKEIYDSQQKKFSLYPEKFFLVKDLWIAVMQIVLLHFLQYRILPHHKQFLGHPVIFDITQF